MARLLLVLSCAVLALAALSIVSANHQEEFLGQVVNASAPLATRLRIVNGCATSNMWIFYLVGQGGGSLNAPNKVRLSPNQGYDYPIPAGGLAASRFWPGVSCDGSGNNCKIGQSGGPATQGFTCPAGIGCAPGIDSKFEATFGCQSGPCQRNPSNNQPLPSTDWWDTSMVDGFTLPYRVQVNGNCPGGPRNNQVDCSGLRLSECPRNIDISTNGQFPNLRGQNLILNYPNSNQGVGCYSPCSKLTQVQWQSLPNPPFHGTTYPVNSGQAQYYCCPTPPIGVAQCRNGPGAHNAYIDLIHSRCPQTYAFAYDDTTGNWQCPSGAQYVVTFLCPA